MRRTTSRILFIIVILIARGERHTLYVAIKQRYNGIDCSCTAACHAVGIAGASLRVFLGQPALYGRDLIYAGIHNKNISAYDIAEVSFEVDSTNYVTDEAHLPADSKVVGNTWLNVNSDGSPDRRYKHNMPCLICEFGKLRISSDTGLDVLFLLSNADNVEQFKSILPQ